MLGSVNLLALPVIRLTRDPGEEVVLLGIFGGVVLPGSPNPDPISDQTTAFSIPVFSPDLLNPYPFADLVCVLEAVYRAASVEW